MGVRRILRWFGWGVGFLSLLGHLVIVQAQPTRGLPGTNGIAIQALKGTAEFIPAGAQRWLPVTTNSFFFPGDQIRVGTNSHLVLLFADQSIVRIRERSELVIQAPKTDVHPRFAARLLTGFLYFFHRDKPTDVEVETRLASAAVRGTEFHLEARANETILTVLEGEVELRSDLGKVLLRNRQQGIVGEGIAPQSRPAIEALNVVQWTLYYPGILDLDELNLTGKEMAVLAKAIQAYRAGDLHGALQAYPTERTADSEAERIFQAALVLTMGRVNEAEATLAGIESSLADALRTLIATVLLRETAPLSPESATAWMAESYRRQALTDLPGALQAARAAVEKSPHFGFALARVAELEFSFAHTSEAARAMATALEKSPRNPQAIALNGFLQAARNRLPLAVLEFERAMEIDPALANAWLGRGLVRIKTGDLALGQEDLVTAAALEPQRAFLRSYLGKGWTISGQPTLARRELEIAKELDRRDPTAWLYSALLNEQQNRINEAVRDLEHSQELNENRAIYRSQFLLDQDRGVRSANLARIYRDAGMTEWSLLSAGRAVSADYANYSAHLFLANSYSLQIDPINRRYETPANAEYLIANLIAPVGAGVLSPTISAHEYSYLFERNRLGFVSDTEYLSRGAWTEAASQFGTFNSVAYSIEGFYQTDNGQRPNGDFEQGLVSVQVKPRLTAQDTLLLRADFARLEGGDLAQRYEPLVYNPGYRFEEETVPALLVGYHREWSPESHTLVLGSRIDVEGSSEDPSAPGLLMHTIDGVITRVLDFLVHEKHSDRIEIYTLEPQHIWRGAKHNTTIGLRGQLGRLNSDYIQTGPQFPASAYFPAVPPEPSSTGSVANDFERLSAYVYHQRQILPSLQLIGGLSYDYIRYPVNWRFTPMQDGSQQQRELSPKGGFIWNPWANGFVRGAYTRSIAGATVDQTYQIEPTQVAGFNQMFRSIVPEAIAGGNTGSEFETFNVSFEQRFPTDTFFLVRAERLNSEIDRELGVYEATFNPDVSVSNSGLDQHLDYREDSLLLAVNQLLGQGLALGIQYRMTQAEYTSRFIDLAPNAVILDPIKRTRRASDTFESILHHARFSFLYNERHGFFARADASWFQQSNRGYTPDLPGDDFWQFDIYAGYRFPGRRVELMLGLLNVTDRNYALSPLNITRELPRSRTLAARARLSF